MCLWVFVNGCVCVCVCVNILEMRKNTNNNQNIEEKKINNPHKIEFEAQRDSFIKTSFHGKSLLQNMILSRRNIMFFKNLLYFFSREISTVKGRHNMGLTSFCMLI